MHAKQPLFLFVHEVPSQPRQLTATDKQMQSVRLKWQESSNPNGVIAKYEIIVVHNITVDDIESLAITKLTKLDVFSRKFN